MNSNLELNNNVNEQQTLTRRIEQKIIFNESEQQTLTNGIK